MASQQDIMRRAMRFATGTGIDDQTSPVIDNEYLYEDYFKIALRRAVEELAKNANHRGALRRNFTLTMTAGKVALSDDVFEDYLNDSMVVDNAAPDVPVSFEPRYADYLRAGFSHGQIGYYTVVGGELFYREPKGDAGVSTATVVLSAVAMPAIPATITDAMAISSELAELTAMKLAALVTGAAMNADAN